MGVALNYQNRCYGPLQISRIPLTLQQSFFAKCVIFKFSFVLSDSQPYLVNQVTKTENA